MEIRLPKGYSEYEIKVEYDSKILSSDKAIFTLFGAAIESYGCISKLPGKDTFLVDRKEQGGLETFGFSTITNTKEGDKIFLERIANAEWVKSTSILESKNIEKSVVV